MNKTIFQEYINHFNNKRYDAVTSYFSPDVTVEYYDKTEFPPGVPARTLYGAKGFIDSYKVLHAHVREALEIGAFLSNDDFLFVELLTEFHCFKDHPNFSAGPLKKGDICVMTNWVLYNLENDKFKRIQIAHWRMHDSKTARL